jgi:hypothetical protein
MKNNIQIFIISFFLFLVPVTTNAATIALPKTAVKSPIKTHKSPSERLMLFGLLGTVAGYGLLYASFSIFDFTFRFLVVSLSFALMLAGVITFVIGLILWLIKKSKETPSV